MPPQPLQGQYVLPLRWTDDARLEELSGYLHRLSRWIPVCVVDGSPAELFARHAQRWAGLVDHVPPEPWPGRNGKVGGVMTGVRRAEVDAVVIADDDVRYREPELRRVLELLERGDLVRPQNFFRPLPWHARWDTARTLLNRAVGTDYPGTFAVRRSTLLAAGGYDGDVLFENLELVRTIECVGGREVRAPEVYVARRPPTVRHFLGQRVRQAYDSMAQPPRLALELSLLPCIVWAGRSRARSLTLCSAVLALAEGGRRRSAGAAVFAPSTTLYAPAWVLERAVCAWLAVARRLTGGVPYAGAKLVRAANPALLAPRCAHWGHPDRARAGAHRRPWRP